MAPLRVYLNMCKSHHRYGTHCGAQPRKYFSQGSLRWSMDEAGSIANSEEMKVRIDTMPSTLKRGIYGFYRM
jgi:hypothetical protein